MTPQLTIPKSGNPYYNTKASGGYSPCILGNYKHRKAGLNVLPNCVGWACGRFNEIGAYGRCKWLGSTNAQNFVKMAKAQGLTVRTEPSLGGVMVWSGGGYGHVAVVEVLTSKDIVITSESEYYGKAFATYSRKRGDGNWRSGCYWMGSTYKYIGCIVNPAVKEVEDLTKAETEALIRQLVPEILEQMKTTKAAQAPDTWAEPAIEFVKAADLMGGYPDGFHAQSEIRREEVAQIIKNVVESLDK